VQGTLESGNPSGYSAVGTVLEVGQGVEGFAVGDRVACAGAQCAFHAEIICVPCNLTVAIPASLEFSKASTVTLGAIALQGVRRASPTLGESFVVLGLGVLGQLTCQILKANGCRVIGIDLNSSRVDLALELGLDLGIYPDQENSIEQVKRLSDGIGVDGVIITAATPADTVMSHAFNMCRKKGRVVLVGAVGLNLKREDFYKKELDFFISTSYGPGRYDKGYEEQGLDYPIGYVRWTENRNMSEYLRLLSESKLEITPLISAIYTVDEAEKAYASIREKENTPIMVLLSYPQEDIENPAGQIIVNPRAQPGKHGVIRVALVGAGGFAKSVHLPNIQKCSDLLHLQAVHSRTGHNANAAAKQFKANYSTTDFSQIVQDPEIDAVLICTRHNLHASMALEAVKAGKHVLVEKPLALNDHDLNEILNFYEAQKENSSLPVLMTGFNRRFSPFAKRIKELTKNRSNPMIINYRMNAGHLPSDSWVFSEEGGGRNLGEACHLYDLFTYLTESRVKSIEAKAIKPATGFYKPDDNFVALISFDDGSLASLTYTALGNPDHPKEQMEVYVDGTVFFLDNYKSLRVSGIKGNNLETNLAEKGHLEELQSFAKVIKSGGDWPIPLWQQNQTTSISLKIEHNLKWFMTGK
jgi:predicted dehydrogenase/threonine dehydrogenase-like Zn-dependent dehydrogenase